MLGYVLNKVVFAKPRPDYLSYSRLQEHKVSLSNLQGWRIVNRNAEFNAVGLYFGGNAEDVARSAVPFSNLGFRTSYCFNYRGYGLSGGTPSQEAFYGDALRIHDHIIETEDVTKLTVVGRSLGASVAIYLSAQRSRTSVILITPFKSMASLVRRKAGPVHWFLNDRFPSDDFTHGNQSPMLMVVAECDAVIPNKESFELFQLWEGPKTLEVIQNAGHNDLHNRPQYSATIREFLHGQ